VNTQRDAHRGQMYEVIQKAVQGGNEKNEKGKMAKHYQTLHGSFRIKAVKAPVGGKELRFLNWALGPVAVAQSRRPKLEILLAKPGAPPPQSGNQRRNLRDWKGEETSTDFRME